MNYVFLIKDFYFNGFLEEFVYIIYILAIVLGVYTIVNKNPISSVLCLIGLFLNVSCLLILISYDFLGLSYILVYVGAVSILFLFILMLINIRISELLSESYNIIPLAIYTVLLIYYIMVQILPNYNYYISLIQWIMLVYSQKWDSFLAEFTHITVIGFFMYTDFSIWLIISSILLLLAMVGAIVITISQKKF